MSHPYSFVKGCLNATWVWVSWHRANHRMPVSKQCSLLLNTHRWQIANMVDAAWLKYCWYVGHISHRVHFAQSVVTEYQAVPTSSNGNDRMTTHCQNEWWNRCLKRTYNTNDIKVGSLRYTEFNTVKHNRSISGPLTQRQLNNKLLTINVTIARSLKHPRSHAKIERCNKTHKHPRKSPRLFHE